MTAARRPARPPKLEDDTMTDGSLNDAAQRYLAAAMREAAIVPGLPPGTAPRPVETAGVVGAGTMGSGIALALLDGGLRVTVLETSPEALARGRALIEKTVAGQVKRGRLDEAAAADRLGRVAWTLDMADFAGADLVIEAVFEEMSVKRDVFARLDAVARPGAILASNTSFLDIDAIAAATARPESVVGLHFFSPANVMRLLEIVRGAQTAPEVIASAFALAARLGKTGVLSGVCDGFIANRLMLPRALQAEAIALSGTPIEAVDRALTGYGFPMGHFRMMDLAGLDVVTRGRSERSLMGDLVAAGRLGQKSGAGFYDYADGRRAVASPVAAQAIAAFARHAGIAQALPADDAAILDRLLLPVVNEGARILAEGIALRASDIDVAAVLGYGWPADRGGPMFWAAQRGLPDVVERLRALEARLGAAFAPCDRLVEAAASGGF
jgi:3-hydroxyacyl-CoA dehydrogenase